MVKGLEKTFQVNGNQKNEQLYLHQTDFKIKMVKRGKEGHINNKAVNTSSSYNNCNIFAPNIKAPK